MRLHSGIRARPHWIRHGFLVLPLLFFISIQGSPYIWRFEVQETPTDNKQSFQIGSGNCSISRCQEPIQIAIIPISVIPSKYYDLYTCFLFDQTKDYCRRWPDEYGGCPYWSCQIHMLGSRVNHFFYQHRKTLFFYIQDPWDSRWETGVVGKLYRKNQPSSPVSTIHIQRKYISIAQPLGIEKVGEIIKHSSEVLDSLTAPLINGTNLSFRLLLQTLTSAYQLLNVTRPGRFKDCWLCVPPGIDSKLSLTASPMILPNNLTSPFVSCPDSDVTMAPYLTSVPLFGMANCFKTSGTCSVGTLSPLDCNKTISLDISSLPQCPAIQNTSILCGTQVYHRLPASWSGVCTLVLLFPELGVIQGNEPLPIPVVDMIAARHERAVQIVPLLVATGIAIGVGTGVAGITTSLAQYNTFTSQFKSDLQGMTETVLTIQKQIDSLAAVVLQNRRGLDVFTAERGGLCLFLQEECCFYVNQSGIVKNKIQELQSDIKNFRDRETSSSGIFENPIWKWILPFVTPFLVIFLMLLFAPCLINLVSTFLQWQMQKISNQTINQLLLQNYQPLPTEEPLSTEVPDAEGPDGENQLRPQTDDAPRQQEAV